MVEAVVEVDLEINIKINKFKISQKIQDMAMEEETKEQGGVIEAEVDGSNMIIVIQMVVGYVAK